MYTAIPSEKNPTNLDFYTYKDELGLIYQIVFSELTRQTKTTKETFLLEE